MKRQGFTVVELMVGIAVAATLALISASLFKAGLSVYNYTLRQNTVLKAATDVLSGEAGHTGVVSTARGAYRILSITGTDFAVVSTGSVVATYALSGTTFNQTKSSATFRQAADISTVTYAYYNINSATGLIIQTTAAVSASFVTAMVKVNGRTTKERSYTFFSGGMLRNHP